MIVGNNSLLDTFHLLYIANKHISQKTWQYTYMYLEKKQRSKNEIFILVPFKRNNPIYCIQENFCVFCAYVFLIS